MAKSFDNSFDQREQIRDAIDIVDLVERYVPLRRQGANFVGRCPWHDDTRPSLQVNAQRQTFKCWVCDIGGDVFSFVMKMENVDFKESMQILADMAGIELIKRRRRTPRQESPQFAGDPAAEPYVDPNDLLSEAAYDDVGDERSRTLFDAPDAPPSRVSSAPDAPQYQPIEIDKPALYRAMEWLAGKYRDVFLHDPEAEEARAYVRDRGISDIASENYMIGYAPLDYDATLRWIRFDRNRVRALETAGVLAFRDEYDDRGIPLPRPVFAPTPQLCDAERRRYYDRFRGRLIFPIRDVQDRVVAFGGRLLPNTTVKSSAKYVNSPETPIFTKSKMVYGLDRARNAIRKSNVVLITEGYTDCIVTAQFGFENVVAVLGTALGPEHVRILKRFADKMILILDGDEAGQKRAREVLQFFVEQGVDMSVLTLPDNNDPCDFLQEKGPEEFERLVARGAVDALDFAFQTATAGIDLDNDLVESTKAFDALLDVIALFPEEQRAINDPVRLRVIKTIQRLALRFRMSQKEVMRQLTEKRARARRYAYRAELREERYEQRAAERDFDELENDEVDPNEAQERRVQEFRRNWVYPAPNSPEETDEELRERFEPFERFVFDDPRLAPSILEREYLEIIVAGPQFFPRLVAKIANEELRSPITRQLDLVARDYFEEGLEPTFDRLVLRYEDEAMKSFLIELDEGAQNKGLASTLASSETSEVLFRDIFSAFERARLNRERPRRMSVLRETNQSPADKLKTLLEIQEALQLKQQKRQKRNASSLFDEENDSSDQELEQ